MVSPTGLNTLIKVTKIFQVLSSLSPDSLLQFFVRPWSWFTILKGWQLKGLAIKGGSNCCSPNLRQTKVSAHHLSVHGRVCKLETCSMRVQNFSGIGKGDKQNQYFGTLVRFGNWGPYQSAWTRLLTYYFVPFPYFESCLYIFFTWTDGETRECP